MKYTQKEITEKTRSIYTVPDLVEILGLQKDQIYTELKRRHKKGEITLNRAGKKIFYLSAEDGEKYIAEKRNYWTEKENKNQSLNQ